MMPIKCFNASKTGFVLYGSLLGALAGCVTHDHAPVVYAPPPPDIVVVQDDYVYYPGYQVYYSSRRRQYVYQEGRSWVSRPAPPRVSPEVLFASPSVRLDFHDAPSAHHATIVRQYPKHWAPPPPGPGPGRGPVNRDGGDRIDRGGPR
jgi:hypothetical protein